MREKIGAEYWMNSCHFCVWVPHSEHIELIIKGGENYPLKKEERGYWTTEIELPVNSLYKYKIDNETFPDPASRSQPDGVHSWSRVVSEDFQWSEGAWKGLSTADMVIYELHVGTFSEEGTFDGVVNKLDHFIELGINTLEIMPIAQFPGNRNWGYDGVFPFAVQNSYGSRESLKGLINACHQKGIAVLLDVVYNHIGPEGNYLASYGPYFTEKYHTPWGQALNFDDEYSDEVRNFFLQNAMMWLEEFHFDGLRLDAVHEIIDRGAKHFLQGLSEVADELETRTGRRIVLIAESDLNDARMVSPYKEGGYGLEAQWVDDFHHSVHTYLTGENNGYYSDFGRLEFLKKTLQQAFVYDGIYSEFRKKSVGNSPSICKPHNFVVSIQNHDQIGNRLLGERLGDLISFEALKLAAGILLISPYVPMLFMGEEFAETRPFQYFVSHSDKALIKAVREGRKKEFRYFFKEEQEEFPDPQDEETFERSKLDWNFRRNPFQNHMLEYYKLLITLRKQAAFKAFRSSSLSVEILKVEVIRISGLDNGHRLVAFANFGKVRSTVEVAEGETLKVQFSSADKRWGGSEDFKNIKPSSELQIQGESLLVLNSQH